MQQIEQIVNASTELEIRRCYHVIHQLRPHLTEKIFVEQTLRQISQGYRFVFLEDSGEVKSVIGFRFLEFLAWGKVLYIDDLVTDAKDRGKGHGGKLLAWTIEQAKQAGYDQVHLDSGPQRHEAHRLYLNHKFKIIGYHFALEL